MTEQEKEQAERLAQYRVLQKLFAMTEAVFSGSSLPKLDLMLDMHKVIESQGKIDMIACFRPQGVDVSLFTTRDITPYHRTGSRATNWAHDNAVVLFWNAKKAEWSLMSVYDIRRKIDEFIDEHQHEYGFSFTRNEVSYHMYDYEL